MDEVLFSLWFFLPAGIANLVPVLAVRIPYLKNLNTPLDFNYKFRGGYIFGVNKTWRGLISGVVIAILLTIWQQKVFNSSSFINELSLNFGVNYQIINPVLLGGLLGFGALSGDAIESFFKRQVGVKPGEKWFPFDQIDYIIGGCLASALIIVLPVSIYITLLIVWFLMHLLVTYIGFLLKFKDSPI